MPVMVDQFFIKQGDVLPDLTVQLTADGQPVALADDPGATVTFFMEHSDKNQGVNVTAEAFIVDAATGTVRHEWNANDTAVPGLYYGEFRVNWSNDDVQRVPNHGYLYIYIDENME